MLSEVVCGSFDCSCIDLQPLLLEKGISQLMYFIMALRTPGVTQELSLIAISWYHLLAGVSFPILMEPMPPLQHLEPMKCIPEIRAFLEKYQL